jgi:hypothetical protein
VLAIPSAPGVTVEPKAAVELSIYRKIARIEDLI